MGTETVNEPVTEEGRRDSAKPQRPKIWREQLNVFLKGKSGKVGVAIIVAVMASIVIGSYLTPFSPNVPTGAPNTPPNLVHLFGTDYFGKDLFSQIVWGAYPTLEIAFIGAILSTIIGFFAGVYSGYYHRAGEAIGGTTDIVLALPSIPFMILVGSIFIAGNALFIGLIAVFLWPAASRSIRAQVLSIRDMPYVQSAKISGLSDKRIVLNVIVPEVISLGIAYFIINFSLGIIIITALQFLGIGNLTVVSWGSILYWAQQYGFVAGDWWWIVTPGAYITLLATATALIGYSLEEVFHPRLR